MSLFDRCKKCGRIHDLSLPCSEVKKEYKTLEIKLVESKQIWKQEVFGEIGHWLYSDGTDAGWVLGCPRCGAVLNLQHEVKVKNEKVTISPSVGCPHCRAHFYVRDGKVEVLPDW